MIAIGIAPYVPFYTLTLTIIELIYMIISANSTPLKYLLSYGIYYLFTYELGTVVLILYSLIYYQFVAINEEIRPTTFKYTQITIVFIMYLILVTHIIFKRISLYSKTAKYKTYFLTFIISIITLMLGINILNGNLLAETGNISANTIQFLLPTIGLIALIYINIFQKFLDIMDENIAMSTELSINELQRDYFERTEDNLKSLSILRHDFKNHLIILKDLANTNQLEKFNDYIDEMQGSLSQTTMVRTPSKVLSAIINSKAQDCKLAGISFSADLKIPLWTMNDYDTVVILGNILDNAINAAKKCDAPFIHLKMQQVSSYLDIDCSNNHCEQINFKDNVFYTTREEKKELHGLGLSSVRRAVDRINGEISIDYTDTTFHVFISYPNYE